MTGVFAEHRINQLAIAQNGSSVGNLPNFIDVVAYEDNTGAIGYTLANQLKELFNARLGQEWGRLIQYQHTGLC